MMKSNKEEIWKDIPGYEGLYQCSNLGEVRSLDRYIKSNSNNLQFKKGKLKNKRICSVGYYITDLYKENKRKTFRIHQLVAITFLNHIPDKYKFVVDHIDNNPLNNNLNNLQIISVRENSSKDKKNGTSQYVGVSWDKKSKKWRAAIRINKTKKYLGVFISEEDARDAYIKELNKINNE